MSAEHSDAPTKQKPVAYSASDIQVPAWRPSRNAVGTGCLGALHRCTYAQTTGEYYDELFRILYYQSSPSLFFGCRS